MIKYGYLKDEWEKFDTSSRRYSLTSVAWSMISVSASPLHVLAERLTAEYGENFASRISNTNLTKYYTEAQTWFRLYKKEQIYDLVLDTLKRAEKECQR